MTCASWKTTGSRRRSAPGAWAGRAGSAGRGEEDHSRYYFETADVERLRLVFDEYEAEAGAALGAGLVLPAHDYVLKCSHLFNVMDTRGAIGVTERAAMFGRMRELSRAIAETYLEQRQALGFPWLNRKPATRSAVPSPIEAARPAPHELAPFLLETR